MLEASIRLWESAYERRAYVTGGLGSRYQGEAFGADYELPNDRAYAETCAAVGGIFWNARLLAATGEARYADWLETSLYNGALVGVSPDGAAYFYANPLAADPQPTPDDQQGLHSSGAQQTVGGHQRQPWYDTACCPPNIARLLLGLPGYGYGVSSDALWVHQFLPGRVEDAAARGRLDQLAGCDPLSVGRRRGSRGGTTLPPGRLSCDCGSRHGPQGRRWRWTVSLRAWRPGPMRLSGGPGRRGHRFV